MNELCVCVLQAVHDLLRFYAYNSIGANEVDTPPTGTVRHPFYSGREGRQYWVMGVPSGTISVSIIHNNHI